jgi:general secretion pathway protein F
VALSAAVIARPITLDQLVALSDEIAALSRAGVPLDSGLAALARDLPGRLGKLAGGISRRLEKGEDLAAIVSDAQEGFPPAYRAVIAAGVRAGRLSAAMEDVARTARRITHLRTTLGTALLYPLAVLVVAWSLFLFVLSRPLPVMLAVMQDVGVDTSSWQRAAAMVSDGTQTWGWLVPAVLALWLAWLWYRTGRVAAGVELHPLLAWGAMGQLRRMQRAGRMAALADLLALLVNHEVPLDEAVELATAAVGSPRLAAGGRELAARIRRGQVGGPPPAGFPPLLAWTIATGNSQPGLPQMLHRTAQTYRDEFQRRYRWIEFYVPVVATALVAGGIVAIYAVLSLGPWIVVMHRLADPLTQ